MIDKISSLWHQLRDGIQNLIFWFPIIWKDRDFDQGYLLDILRFKLVRMEKFFRSKYAWTLHAKHRADEMREVILLLDRIREDGEFDYYENTFRYHKRKWGEIDMWTTPCPDKEDLHEVSITRPMICTPNDIEEEHKESRRLYAHVQYLEKQDIDRAFNLIARNIRGWWD
jgi:hypothetical protein